MQKEPVAEFDERLWGAMVDYVTVGADKRLTVVFRDGTGEKLGILPAMAGCLNFS